MRSILFLSFYFFFLAARSQQVRSFNLYFETDKYSLTGSLQEKIDSVIKKLSNIPKAYAINISGHTDNEGDLAYNKNLSLQRANKVKEHFINKGFYGKHITINAYAYVKPVANNKNEEGKSKNRRVTVSISVFTPDISKAVSSDNKTKLFSLNADSGGSFKYNSGSEITIPANAFETIDGIAVNGSVDIKYTEYRSQLDFIASGIPMSFYNDKKEFVQFNSGGMFNVEAFKGDKKLKLKENKELKVKFAKTQSLPEMKFFSFDTVHNAWKKEPQKLNVAVVKTFITLMTEFPGKKKIIKNISDKDSCILYPCTGNFFSIRKGIELALSAKPINIARPGLCFKELDHPGKRSESFSLKIISFAKSKVEFQMIPHEKESVFEMFKEYHWVYKFNEDHLFKKEWAKTTWLRVKVDYLTGDNFKLTLFSNASQLEFLVEAKVDQKVVGNNELYKFHQTNKALNLEKYLEYHSNVTAYDKKTDLQLNNEGFNAGEFEQNCKDSLMCFYQYNRQWMDEENGESSLTYRQWLDYFNSHKALMKARYLELEKDINIITPTCKAAEAKRVEEEAKQKEIVKKNRRNKFVVDSLSSAHSGEQLNVLNSQFEALSIKSLGVWNCDQVQRLKEPVYVRKTYSDEKGKKLEPIVVYIIDKEVSGTLTYNGYRDLSPYYFPVSSKSENTLIAFDINNKAYICDSDKFSNFVKNKDGSQIILSPLKNANEQIPSFN